jgi:hypothetical protein
LVCLTYLMTLKIAIYSQMKAVSTGPPMLSGQ